jgi:hypothetical protein
LHFCFLRKKKIFKKKESAGNKGEKGEKRFSTGDAEKEILIEQQIPLH